MKNVEVALNVRAKLGECPRWDEKEQLLYWVDIDSFQLHRFDPKTGKDDFITFKEEIACFSLRQNHDGFLVAMRSGFHFLDGWNTKLRAIADPEATLVKNRFNDGRCDAEGRMIAGSVYPPKDHDGANLWQLGTDLKVTKLAEGLLTSNGAGFSPDNKTFYFSDTPKHVIYKYDYDLATGEMTNGTVFHQFPFGNGRPDGAAVDSEGCYWTALYEGSRIVRLSPEGEILQEIDLPVRCPTMVAFGGEDLKTLYITTVGARPEEELRDYPLSGALLKVEVDVPGLVEHRFAL
ncbi:SMP-30/gluconolactonase/LRE family protein [Saccharophagus degradans]|uniref:Gluconolactonase n=1 Tax=Saccharophagus degradans (strain 2-40 / ATCC 43961 / DSM 17024) TaxID=203122 RepID=Q21FQ8_SACD2|nr:SMP-30/gluconolactonase/LRE family protein [Saccharophagus degradans]ABD82471.1 gluconolactonase [Saccharophagus degradans 2-40]WGO99333.1 SMP-30/gluconolactonase/LRE family protein [Saccharophagus degradans]